MGVLKDSSTWVQYSPPAGKVDEIPVFVGSVVKACSLQVKNVSGMETWNELLIATAHSDVLRPGENLGAKHMFEAECLWFKELQAMYYSEELCFLGKLQNHTTKDKFSKHIV